MKLKTAPIWPKENVDSNQVVQRFAANELYVPSVVYREFGLPILHWERWIRNTLEGMFAVIYINIFHLLNYL